MEWFAAMGRIRNDVVVQIRLLARIDTKLRRHVSKKGDVKTHVLAMLEAVDLNKCPVPAMQYGAAGPKSTTVIMPSEIYEWVEKAADARECSINALLNGGIAAYVKLLGV